MSDHYKKLPSGIFEPIEIWMRNGLNACAGNMLKYMVRFPYKGTPYQDWVKVRDYYEIWEKLGDTVPKPKRALASITWCKDSINWYIKNLTMATMDVVTSKFVIEDIAMNNLPPRQRFDKFFNAVMTGDYMRPYLPIVPRPKQFESNDGC